MPNYSKEIADLEFNIRSAQQGIDLLAQYACGLKTGIHKWGDKEREQYPKTVKNLEGQIIKMRALKAHYTAANKRKD